MWYSFPTLAFGFGSPLLLWGLALGSIPIIVHLLHRRQYKETEWAAMRFLLEAARKNARRTRLEQQILLAVRVLLFVLLAGALAEPFFESYSALVSAPRPVHRILVIDASFSMGDQAGESNRFDRAKEAAKAIAETARDGDAFHLVRISNSQPRVIVRQPSYRPAQVIEEIESLKLTEEPGELTATLHDVDELVGTLPEIPDKHVMFFSDLQRSSWSPEATDRRAEIQKLLRKIAGESELTVIDLGREKSANRAVVDLRTDEPFVTVGQEVLLQAAVQNFGPARLEQQPVELYVDDALVRTEQVSIDPGATAVADFRTSFSQGGEHRVEAKLTADSLILDDRRWLALPTVDSLNILLVNGKPAGRSTDRATYYLETVVAPTTSREPWQGATRAGVIGDGELTSQDLNRYDCVFLCDVGQFTAAEATMLQAYVESGGGLILFPGSLTAAENYNQTLYRDGDGILPVRLGERVTVSNAADDGFKFDLGDLTHPIVSAFEGNPGTGLESAITLEYVKTQVPAESEARVALRYLNGDPAVVEKRVGRGRAILVTTSADVEWGTWPVVRSFPPVVHEMIRYAVSGRRTERGLLVGEPIVKSFAARGTSGNATVTRPDGTKESVSLVGADSLAKLTFESTGQSGIYDVAVPGSGNAAELFAANVDTRESDGAKNSDQDLETEILAHTPFVYRTNLDDLKSDSSSSESEHAGLTRWLLVAVFAMLFVEQLMAWRFFYGLLLLYVVVAVGLAWNARVWHPWAPAFVVAIGLVGLAAIALAVRRTRQNRPGLRSFRSR